MSSTHETRDSGDDSKGGQAHVTLSTFDLASSWTGTSLPLLPRTSDFWMVLSQSLYNKSGAYQKLFLMEHFHDVLIRVTTAGANALHPEVPAKPDSATPVRWPSLVTSADFFDSEHWFFKIAYPFKKDRANWCSPLFEHVHRVRNHRLWSARDSRLYADH